jgi:hypothetical protein
LDFGKVAELANSFRKCYRTAPLPPPGYYPVNPSVALSAQHPQYPGGAIAAFTSQSKLFIFIMLFLIHANRIQMHKNETKTIKKN